MFIRVIQVKVLAFISKSTKWIEQFSIEGGNEIIIDKSLAMAEMKWRRTFKRVIYNKVLKDNIGRTGGFKNFNSQYPNPINRVFYQH